MTRREISSKIALELGMTKEAAKEVVNRFLARVIEGIAESGHVELRGFGVFDLRRSAPRLGRNPRTGEPVEIPAKPRVRFKPGETLAAALAENDRIASEIDAGFADADRDVAGEETR